MLKTLVRVSRPLSWIVTVAAVGIGLFLGLRPQEDIGHLLIPILIVLFYFTLPYNLFVYGLDQIGNSDDPDKKDKRLRRWLFGLNIPLVLVLLFISGSIEANLVLFGLLFAAYVYNARDFWLKEVPVAGFVLRVWRFFGVFVYGLLLASITLHQHLIALAVGLAVCIALACLKPFKG